MMIESGELDGHTAACYSLPMAKMPSIDFLAPPVFVVDTVAAM